MVGIALWLALTPMFGLMEVAAGYACGTGLAAATTILAATRRQRLAWDGLWVKTVLYASAVVFMSTSSLTAHAPWSWKVLQVLTLWALWGAVNRRQMVQLGRSRTPT